MAALHIMAKQQVNVKLDPKLLADLRARVKLEPHTNVTSLLERGAKHVLAQPVPRVQPQMDVTPARARTAATMQQAAVEAIAKDQRPCGRRSHPFKSHWSRGCLAGCACGEKLFREKSA